MLTAFHTSGHIPSPVKKGIVTPFFKGTGDRANLQNWRPITLLNSAPIDNVPLGQYIRTTLRDLSDDCCCADAGAVDALTELLLLLLLALAVLAEVADVVAQEIPGAACLRLAWVERC